MRFTAHEFVKLFKQVSADAYGASTEVGVGVDTTDFREALICLDIGDMAATSTVDVKVEDSADNSTFADVTGAAFTQLTQAGGDGNTLEVGRLNVENVRKFIRISVTIAAAASDLSAFIVAVNGRNLPFTPENTLQFNV